MNKCIVDEEYWEYLFTIGRDILCLQEKQDYHENVIDTNLYYNCERKNTYESCED